MPVRAKPTLPAAILKELNQAGHNVPSRKNSLTRKESRKKVRKDAKQKKGNQLTPHPHPSSSNQRKRNREEVPDVEQSPAKRIKTFGAPTARVPHRSQTSLEKLSAAWSSQPPAKKSGSGKKPSLPKDAIEEDEDRKIAWLERQLGKSGKEEEMMQDGLDDILNDLDNLEETLGSVHDSARGVPDNTPSLDSDEGRLSNDEYESDSDHTKATTTSQDEKEEGASGLDESENSEEEGDDDERDSALTSMDGDDRDMQQPTHDSGNTSSQGIYKPPHLRERSAQPTHKTIAATEHSPDNGLVSSDVIRQSSLRAPLLGLLNRLAPSSASLSTLVPQFSSSYASGEHPRPIISAILSNLIVVDIIGSKEQLGDGVVYSCAGLVGAFARGLVAGSGTGREFCAEVTVRAVHQFDHAVQVAQSPLTSTLQQQRASEELVSDKAPDNLIRLFCALYMLRVIGPGLIYELLKLIIGETNGEAMSEMEVELVLKILKSAGQQLRHDDPLALKEIVSLVHARHVASTATSRTKFMLEELSNLNSNRALAALRAKGLGSAARTDAFENVRTFLASIDKKNGSPPDPLVFSLSDLRTSVTKGIWWLVGPGHMLDKKLEPLVMGATRHKQNGDANSSGTEDAKLRKLAKKQGMNTDVRSKVFRILIASEDYVDASEKLAALKLTEVQQREIIRVLLHCLGNEKAYNPYYALIGQHLASRSHSHLITMQYCLWDFMRNLSAETVSGAQGERDIPPADPIDIDTKAGKRRVENYAKAYGWWIGRDVLSLRVLKPVPLGKLKSPAAESFLQKLITFILISTQTTSPLLAGGSYPSHQNKKGIERVFGKIAQTEPKIGKMLLRYLQDGFRTSNQVSNTTEIALNILKATL